VERWASFIPGQCKQNFAKAAVGPTTWLVDCQVDALLVHSFLQAWDALGAPPASGTLEASHAALLTSPVDLQGGSSDTILLACSVLSDGAFDWSKQAFAK
jgi:hypothetical protein